MSITRATTPQRQQDMVIRLPVSVGPQPAHFSNLLDRDTADQRPSNKHTRLAPIRY